MNAINELLSIPPAPAPTAGGRPDVVLQLRAESAAYAALESLREAALARGEARYAAGPGKRRPRNWELLSEDDPVFRAEKKTRSAYVSRFRAKEYETLLEDRVAAGEDALTDTRGRLTAESAENATLKEQLARLRAQVANPPVQTAPVVVEVKETPMSPFSEITGSPCSSPEQSPPSNLPDISLDGFPLLPPSFSKLEADLVERWSSDDDSFLLA